MRNMKTSLGHDVKHALPFSFFKFTNLIFIVLAVLLLSGTAGAVFEEVASLTTSAPYFDLASVIDSTNTFAYFGTDTSPAKVIKVQLSDFTEVASLTTSGNKFKSSVIDSTNTFAYFGTDTSPTKVIKVQLSDFTEVASLTTSGDWFKSSVIDSTNTFAYFGTDTSPAKVIKVQLSDFTEVASLTTNASYLRSSAVIDSTNTFAYFGTYINSPPNIIKVQLSDFTEVASLTTNASYFVSAVIDSTNTFAYFGTDTTKIFKVQLSDFTEVASLTTSSGYLRFGVIDSTNTFAYFGTNTNPAKIIKVQLSAIITPFDPSGYVKDTNGNALFNAKATLSNATFNVTDYSDLLGYWNVDIYENGTYNYNVSLNGYVTSSGSQTFNIGGTDYNFTLTPNKARLYGNIYEWTNESGSKSIVGDLKSIKQIFKGGKNYLIYAGSTVTLPAPDLNTYVFKLNDVDVSGNSALISIFYKGNAIFSIQYVEENKDYRWLVSSTATTELYLVGNFKNMKGDGESHWIEVSLSYDVRQKSVVSAWDLITFWYNYLSSDIAYANFFIDLINWIDFLPDKPEMKVTFNASTGSDSEAEMVMDFSSDTSLTTYSLTIRTKNDGTQGKIGYGFTDDDIEVAPNYKDVLIQTGNNEYATADYRKFADTDTDGDKKIKVWLYFYSGYGSKWDFNYFVTAFCTGCNLKPLADATIYQSFNNNTKSSAIGFYNLYVPFGTYNISYSKDGYESKSISFTFDATNNVNNTNMVINKSTTEVIEQKHYVKVLPDPSNQGTAISAYYKTLNAYSYYKISVCPFNDEANCLDSYDSDFGVAPNKESFVALKTYPIGTYSVYLSGKDLFDWSWTVAVVNNFTITSSIPVANWESSLYYLGENMRVNVYIPSGSENLTITYPNSTVLYSGTFSAATTVQNYTIATNNLSVPGKYTAKVTGNNNISVTELLPILAANYSLSTPANMVWGKSFTVQYQSPKTSELIILKSDGSPAYPSKTVVGSKSVSFNTSSLENKADTLTIKLIQNNVEKAKITISINKGTTGTGAAASIDWLGSSSWLAIIILVMFVGIGAMYGGAAGMIGGAMISIPILYLAPGDYSGHMIPLWIVFLEAAIVFVIVAVLVGTSVTKQR